MKGGSEGIDAAAAIYCLRSLRNSSAQFARDTFHWKHVNTSYIDNFELQAMSVENAVHEKTKNGSSCANVFVCVLCESLCALCMNPFARRYFTLFLI
jgi:hypothetical protein